MRQMHARVSKTDARIRRGEQHVGAGFVIAWIGDRATQIRSDKTKRFQTPQIANRVRALICRA